MSEFGEQVDGILAKARSTWTPDEYAVIDKLLQAGNRHRLSQVLEEVRGPDFKGSKEDVQLNTKLSAEILAESMENIVSIDNAQEVVS